MHRSALRLLQAALLAIGVGMVPLATVSACSCAFTEFGEAVLTADVAIVGTAVEAESAGRGEIGETIVTTWRVERSREAIDSDEITTRSHADTGANCGASFGVGERWLVLAYGSEGTLETNGCMQNRRLDGTDAEAEAVSAELLTVVPEGVASEGSVALPGELLGLGAAVLVIGVASLVAFRRSMPR